jgi:chaperone BCS1
LDPALIRPGRIDFQALISYCTPDQISHLFQNFYPEADLTVADNFINRLKEIGIDSMLSPASLQGHFLMYKNSPELAISNAHEILTPSSKKVSPASSAVRVR